MISDLVQKIIDQKEEMQNEYDKETDFGRKPLDQKRWQARITNLLS